MKKMFQPGLFSPLGRWTGNNYLSKGGLKINNNPYIYTLACQTALTRFVLCYH